MSREGRGHSGEERGDRGLRGHLVEWVIQVRGQTGHRYDKYDNCDVKKVYFLLVCIPRVPVESTVFYQVDYR